MAAFQVKVGPNGWDAVAYVRNRIEDTDATDFGVPDAAFQAYHKAAADEYSRHRPMTDQVGDPYLATSPLVTATGVRRYLCNNANGFNDGHGNERIVARVNEVLYRPAGGYSAATELGYFALLPFSPVNAFLMDPGIMDEPSLRYLRDKQLNELDHYGRGNAESGIDPSGYRFLDLYPTPVTAGLPIYVRYDINHVNVPDGNGNAVYATVLDGDATVFGNLLLAEVMDQEADRVARIMTAKAGQVSVQASPETIRVLAETIKANALLRLGIAVSVGEATS